MTISCGEKLFRAQIDANTLGRWRSRRWFDQNPHIEITAPRLSSLMQPRVQQMLAKTMAIPEVQRIAEAGNPNLPGAIAGRALLDRNSAERATNAA